MLVSLIFFSRFLHQVLACDGVFELMTSEQVVDFVRVRLAHNVPISRIAESLVEEGCTKNPRLTLGRGTDNQTCIIVRLNVAKASDPSADPHGDDVEDEINPFDGGADVSFAGSEARDRDRAEAEARRRKRDEEGAPEVIEE
jgi:protein phosphatase 2C family protein 2/3